MAFITDRHIYRRQRDSDLPVLHRLGLCNEPDPHGFRMSVLDRKTLAVVGSVRQEVIADENHHAKAQRLSALATAPKDEQIFLRDVMRSKAHLGLSLPWLLPETTLYPQDIAPETAALANTALYMFSSAFPAAASMMDGRCFSLSTGKGCSFLFSIDKLNCGLLLTAGFASHMVPVGPVISSALTLRIRHFADTEADVADFMAKAQTMYASLCSADKRELQTQHKARQKAFLLRINDHLKPLGFRKHGTRWELAVNSANTVVVEAQKARFSDQFYLNLWADFDCPGIRLEQDIDWQLLSDADIDDLMRMYLVEDILPLITLAQGGIHGDRHP